jgi:hypothetical protein
MQRLYPSVAHRPDHRPMGKALSASLRAAPTIGVMGYRFLLRTSGCAPSALTVRLTGCGHLMPVLQTRLRAKGAYRHGFFPHSFFS